MTYSYDPIEINGTNTAANNVGDYVLVLYNADSTDSTALMNYYRLNRPGMANATYLGLSATNGGYLIVNGTGVAIPAMAAAGFDPGVSSLPETGGVGSAFSTSYASEAICDAIAGYVNQWVRSSQLPIRYIVGLCGLPSRVGYYANDGGASVSYMIYSELLAGTGKAGYTGGTDRFSVAEYGAPLISWLDCGSYDATYAYINKEIVTAYAGGLESDGITISGSAAGVGGTTYYLDDTTVYSGDYFDDYYSALVAQLEAQGVLPEDISDYIVHHSKADNSLIATFDGSNGLRMLGLSHCKLARLVQLASQWKGDNHDHHNLPNWHGELPRWLVDWDVGREL